MDHVTRPLIEVPKVIIYFARVEPFVTGCRRQLHQLFILVRYREHLAVNIREGNIQRKPTIVRGEEIDPAVIAPVDLHSIQGGF